jgi:hypothetical protein
MSAKIKTLDQAKTRITELEAQLGGKQSAVISAVKPSFNLNKRTAATPSLAPTLSADFTIADLKAQINEADGSQKIRLLGKLETHFRAEITAEKDPVKQVALTRELSRVAKQKALAMFDNPTEWAKRYRQDEE